MCNFFLNKCFCSNCWYCRRDRKERSSEKERPKKMKEDGEDDRYWPRDSSRSSRKPGSAQRSGSFRHEQPIDRGSHSDHDRWSSGQGRDRYSNDHKRDRYDYPRSGPPYHRDRDHARLIDKRYL